MTGAGLRILHVIPAVAPRYGGPSVALGGMCRALLARGHHVQVVTTDADGRARLRVETGVPVQWDGVPAVFFRAHLGEGLKASPGLRRWLAESVGDFDVVHIHSVFSHPSLVAGRACRARGIPYVVRPLGTLTPWSLGQKAWKKRAFMALAGKRLLRGAAAIHYTTPGERELVENVFPVGRSVVIPLGIPDEWFDMPAPEPAAREPIVAVVTRLAPKKNLELLVRAFLRVTASESLAKWRLVIAGDGDQPVRKRLADLAAGDRRVTLAGWVDDAARRQLLRQASLFALPSAQENFGLAVLEALAEGLPVVVSRAVNLSSEVVAADAGWVVDPTEADLVRALTEALSREDLRSRCAANARRMAASYRWSSVGAMLDRCYRSLVDAHEGRARLVAG